MTPYPIEAIEFMGGPFDGFLQLLDAPLDEFQRFVAVPVNRNVVAMLGGRQSAPQTPATSVAVYELEATATVPYYRFVGSGAPGQFELAHWVG